MTPKLMIDIETTSTAPNAGILSIGAKLFCLTGEEKVRTGFYSTILATSVISHKSFDVSEDTMDWWAKQDEKAKAEAFSGTEPFGEVLADFADYVKTLPEGIEIWANGKFDTHILEHGFKVANIPCPWKYHQVRDFRTLKNLPFAPPAVAKNEQAHNAFFDAEFQARWAEDIFAAMPSNGKTFLIISAVIGSFLLGAGATHCILGKMQVAEMKCKGVSYRSPDGSELTCEGKTIYVKGPRGEGK